MNKFLIQTLEFPRIGLGEVDVELFAPGPEFFVSGQDVSDHLSRHPANDFFRLNPAIHGNHGPFTDNGPLPDHRMQTEHRTHADDGKIIDPIAMDDRPMADGDPFSQNAQPVGSNMDDRIFLHSGARSDSNAAIIPPQDDPMTDVTFIPDFNIPDDPGGITDINIPTDSGHPIPVLIKRHARNPPLPF